MLWTVEEHNTKTYHSLYRTWISHKHNVGTYFTCSLHRNIYVQQILESSVNNIYSKFYLLDVM